MERVRRTRAKPEVVEEKDTGGIDIHDSPDKPRPGETEEQAMARIEAKYRARATSPLKSIRAFCVMCVGCYPRAVAKCKATDCVLHPFRFGRNPFQKHVNRKKPNSEE